MPSVRVMPPAGPPILPAAILNRINDGSKLQGPAACRFRKRLFCGGLPEHPPGSCSQRTPESNHDQGCCRHLVNCGFVAALIKGAAAFLQVHRRGDAGGDLPDAGRRTLRPLRPRHRHSRAATQRLHEHVRPKEARLILIAPTESHRLDPASTPKIERVSFF